MVFGPHSLIFVFVVLSRISFPKGSLKISQRGLLARKRDRMGRPRRHSVLRDRPTNKEVKLNGKSNCNDDGKPF